MTRPWFRVGIVIGSALLSGCTGELESTSSPAPGTGASGGTTSPPPGGLPPGSPQGSGGTGTGTASGGATPSGSGGAPSSTGAPPSGAGAPPSGGAGAPTTTAVTGRVGLAARISKVEYANSVADVLGTTLTAAELDAQTGGIPDDAGDGVFKHIADKQTSIEQHALSYFPGRRSRGEARRHRGAHRQPRLRPGHGGVWDEGDFGLGAAPVPAPAHPARERRDAERVQRRGHRRARFLGRLALDAAGVAAVAAVPVPDGRRDARHRGPGAGSVEPGARGAPSRRSSG